jgi:hypothetical protein
MNPSPFSSKQLKIILDKPYSSPEMRPRHAVVFTNTNFGFDLKHCFVALVPNVNVHRSMIIRIDHNGKAGCA